MDAVVIGHVYSLAIFAFYDSVKLNRVSLTFCKVLLSTPVANTKVRMCPLHLRFSSEVKQ